MIYHDVFLMTAGHVEDSEKKCMLEVNSLQFPFSWIFL